MESTVLNLSPYENFYTQEAYKTLRTNLLFCGRDIQIIAVTSHWENEGKTTVVLNLAKSLTELGKMLEPPIGKSAVYGRLQKLIEIAQALEE